MPYQWRSLHKNARLAEETLREIYEKLEYISTKLSLPNTIYKERTVQSASLQSVKKDIDYLKSMNYCRTYHNSVLNTVFGTDRISHNAGDHSTHNSGHQSAIYSSQYDSYLSGHNHTLYSYRLLGVFYSVNGWVHNNYHYSRKNYQDLTFTYY